MVGDVNVQYELLLTSIFQFLRPQKICLSMAAILNFSKTVKKSLAHLHIMGNVNNFRLSFGVFAPTNKFGVEF